KGHGTYHLDVNLDGGQFGQSKQAKYEVHHAGMVDTVIVDQSAADGWFPLGDFELAGTGDEFVELGDNTGEPGSMNIQVLFDALRAQSLDEAGGGCCDSTRDSSGSAVLALLVLAALTGSGSRRHSRSRARMSRCSG